MPYKLKFNWLGYLKKKKKEGHTFPMKLNNCESINYTILLNILKLIEGYLQIY